MINVIVPLAGTPQFFNEKDYKYPKPLVEIAGKTMVEIFLQTFNKSKIDLKFIFVVNEDDCRKFHLHDVLRILTDDKCEVVKISSSTKGAACSVLMAIEHIKSDKPLIVVNADQYLDVDLNDVLNTFANSDAGVITFNSVHPKWSYVRLNAEKRIIETAEKRPLSNNAIAGFYYFSEGQYFIDSAMKMIKKDASVEQQFYIAPVLNELVLMDKCLDVYEIDTKNYHTFYSPQKIKEYERLLC